MELIHIVMLVFLVAAIIVMVFEVRHLKKKGRKPMRREGELPFDYVVRVFKLNKTDAKSFQAYLLQRYVPVDVDNLTFIMELYGNWLKSNA